MNLPSTFWDALIHFDGNDRSYRSEGHVTQFNVDLIRAILNGLGMTAVTIVPVLHNFDSIPDLTLLYGRNCVAGLSWEDKKGNGGDATWESGTQVAGQVFEQLAVNHVSLGCPVYGILSTYNSVRLVSSHNFSDVVINNERAMSLPSPGAPDTTPDKEAPVGPFEGYRAEKTDVKTFPKNDGKDEDEPKGRKTRIQEFAEFEDRTFYASEVYSIGNDEQKNRAAIKLIATAIMLAKQSVDAPARDVTAVPLSGPARVFSSSKRMIYNSPVALSKGIQFDLRPTSLHQNFYAFKQIGAGATSVCCLATTSDSAACALKIFHTAGPQGRELAVEEAGNWKEIYGRDDWKFIRAHEIAGRHFLVLPYFTVPSCQSERDSLVSGGQNSLLWEALARIADAGYAHNDIKWHHVGTIRTQQKKRDHQGNRWEVKAFILDLGDVQKLQPSERDSWVSDSFKFLKERRHESSSNGL